MVLSLLFLVWHRSERLDSVNRLNRLSDVRQSERQQARTLRSTQKRQQRIRSSANAAREEFASRCLPEGSGEGVEVGDGGSERSCPSGAFPIGSSLFASLWDSSFCFKNPAVIATLGLKTGPLLVVWAGQTPMAEK